MTVAPESDFYDDAEFFAIRAVRSALTETSSSPASDQFATIVAEMLAKHSDVGVVALVAAMSRQYSAALEVVASNRNMTAMEVLDSFELHKVGQIVEENEEVSRAVDGSHGTNLDPADLTLFQSLDDETRELVLRLLGMLGDPTEIDFKRLADHPQSGTLSAWLLTLPAYRNARHDDPEGEA